MQSELVRATGAVMNFIAVLNDELVKVGGNPAMIYFAQMSHARPMMKLLAKTIVESKLWRIPRSLIIEEIARNQDDPECFEHDTKWCWCTFSRLAEELTTLKFVDRRGCFERGSGKIQGIPPELVVQVQESYEDKSEKVCVVIWRRKSYVVTYWAQHECLYLAPAEYFDFDN